MRGRAGVWAVAAVLVAGVLYTLLSSDAIPPPLEIGRPAPVFELPPVGGGAPIALASLRGRPVLVSFWATWCKPCEDEMPAMERLYRSLHGSGFELLAVSVDTGEPEVVTFRDRLGITFPILHDPDRRVSHRYQALRFPESWLIGPDGTLVARFIGPREWDAPEYEARIRSLLAAPSAPQ
jgi:cytochrome c biogenesis protein CcmG/thiol:disulfide interchange protein DsbE